MFTFKTFLKEQSITEELLLEAAASASAANDDKGKLHELLLAKYLHPETRLPDHHRSESENDDHAGTPQQVHDRLNEKMGPAAMNEIRGHSKQSSQALHQYLKEVV